MMQIILFIMINRVIRQYGSTQFPYWLPGDLDLLKLSALSAISGALPFRSAWAQTDAIQFGCPVPMSGAFAANGKYADIGMKLALEQRGTLLNRPLAYTVLDTEGKPATAVRKVQEAVQQKGARYFAGGILSSEALAMGKELERLNGIFITTAGADEITGKDCNKATFRWSVPTYGAINQTVRPLIERHPNAKRWYTISGPTYTGQRACMGRSAVLDIGQARLVITERTHEPWDLGVFEEPGAGSSPGTLPVAEIAHVLPPCFRANLRWADRMRQPRRNQRGLVDVPVQETQPPAVSAGRRRT